MTTSSCANNTMAYSNNDPNCPQNRSASVFYFITTISAMLVLATATLLFFCCLLLKRRRVQIQLRGGNHLPPLGPAPRGDVASYEFAGFYGGALSPGNPPNPQPSRPAPERSNGDAATAKEWQDSGPFHCVIMAGEDQATYIAHPIPQQHAKADPSQTRDIEDPGEGMHDSPKNDDSDHR